MASFVKRPWHQDAVTILVFTSWMLLLWQGRHLWLMDFDFFNLLMGCFSTDVAMEELRNGNPWPTLSSLILLLLKCHLKMYFLHCTTLSNVKMTSSISVSTLYMYDVSDSNCIMSYWHRVQFIVRYQAAVDKLCSNIIKTNRL